MWVDVPWGVTVGFPMDGLVAVSGNGDALAGVNGIVIDGFSVRPSCGVEFRKVG